MSVETPARVRSTSIRLIVAPVVLGACLLWAYWPTLRELVDRWLHDSHYSHGFLVPLFALALPWLRSRRNQLEPRRKDQAEGGERTPHVEPVGVTTSDNWIGVLLIGLGGMVEFVGTYYFVEWLAAASMLPMIAGVCVLAGGRPLLNRAWPSIAFLVFMIPLPYRVEVSLGSPLQRLATVVSTFTLQTTGLPAVADGNIVRINEHQLAVVEACNGLGMLVTFVTIAVGLALVINRRREDKVLIILSSIPIALLANVARITITGFLTELVNTHWGDVFFHDFAGWLMMPLAIVILWLELWLLSHLLIEPPPREVPIPISLVEARRTSRALRPRKVPPRAASRSSASPSRTARRDSNG